LINRLFVAGLLSFSLAIGLVSTAAAASATFSLLQSPGLAGHKPNASAASGWLVGTASDQVLAANFNPLGGLSHNFADLAGMGGAQFNFAPSLAGSLTLDFGPSNLETRSVSVSQLAYSGQATPMMFLNQFLVTASSPAASNPAFNVDGVSSSGLWQNNQSGYWAISYDLDFYFATNADGDAPVNPLDVDATFNDKRQRGYLLPVARLTPEGLNSLALDDPAGHFSDDLADYLLNVVAPLLPSDATYLLFTQMEKNHPDYTEPGLPITPAGFIGNTTIAYTTGAIPEPTPLGLVLVMTALLSLKRRDRRS
jgi:hypothetical protein